MSLGTNSTAQLSARATNILRDIKPPVEIPNRWLWVWWSLAALAGMILLLVAWRYWNRKREATPTAPVIPAHVRAKQRLQEALAFLGQPREFCTLVSDTIRFYLE